MKETLFMGIITAAATHELKNVLATIGASAGLMQDFLNIVKDESFQYKERFLKIITSIEEQVVRGDDISTVLNRFAHSPDHESSSENVQELADQMIVLTARLAKANEVSFVNESSQEYLTINCDPLRTRMLLYQAMDALMGHAGRGQKFSIKIWQDHGRETFAGFYPEPLQNADNSFGNLIRSEQWADLVNASNEQGAKADFNAETGVLKLDLPNLETKLIQ